MELYLKKQRQNFGTIFLQIICMVLKVNENGLLKIKYIDENSKDSNLQKLPLYIPNNSNEKSIESDELKIAKEIIKNTKTNLFCNLPYTSNQIINRAINLFKYDIHAILPELDKYFNSIKFYDTQYNISLFDIFFFSLIINKFEILLDEIHSNFKNVFAWLKFLLSLEQISEVCNKLKIDNVLEKNINNLFEEFIDNEKIKKKYFVLYNKKNGGIFTEFNGRQILNKSTNQNFIDGKIYYFFSNKNETNLEITNQTKIFNYILKNKISYDENIPFSTYGKLMERNRNIFVILSDIYKQVIFLNDKDNIMKNKKINKFYDFLCMKMTYYDEVTIFLETTRISQIKSLKSKSKNNKNKTNIINKKILIKYNFIDYSHNSNHYNFIGLYNSQEKITIQINNKTIYFAYTDDIVSQEYFPQDVELLRNKNDSKISKYRILLLKGYCNEINVFINNVVGGFAYEYYYISKRNEFLPKTIEIQLNNNLKYKSDKFWKFDTSNRQKITFINIPNQDLSLNSFEYNSFLKIISCISSNELVNYGIFLLDKLVINRLEKIKIDSSFQSLIKDIQDDIHLYQNGKKTSKDLEEKYLRDKIKYINLFSYDYRGYYFPNNIEYFNYFNKMCIWMILANTDNKEREYAFKKYDQILSLIQNKKNMSYEEKTILLITVIRRVLDNKSKSKSIIFPKVIFFDEINKIDYCYKKAYDFHLDLIDSLTENSKLIQPFLQLNSYIMEMLLTEKDINIIKKAKIDKINHSDIDKKQKTKLINNVKEEKLITKSAYTISMIPLDVIKEHLKSTMKPYAIIWQKNNEETFAASVYKDNNIICFNEEEIFKGIYDGRFYDLLYRSMKEDAFAFILNLYYLHENSSHNKEKVFNSKEKDSPFIFMNENLKLSLIFCDENCDSGEAGCFTESFIAERSILLDLVNINYNFGDLLKVKYFNQENFMELLNIYKSRKLSEKTDGTKVQGKNVVSSQFKLDKNIKKTSKNNYDKVKRDIFGFSHRDNNLFKEAKQRHCFY